MEYEYTIDKSIDIRDKNASVIHRTATVNSMSTFSLTKGNSPEKINILKNFTIPQRSSAFHFVLNGQARFTQNNHVPPAFFRGDQCNLMIIQPHQTLQTLSTRGDFMMASFYMDLNSFISIVDDTFESLPPKFRKATISNMCSCNSFRWEPHFYKILMQIANTTIVQSEASIFLESKMFELIAHIVHKGKHPATQQSSMSRTIREKIEYAYYLIQSNIAAPPSLTQLARIVCTNEFTLKKGFREIYGKPVYKLLLQRRMEKAMEYVLDGTLPIAEIGECVGYQDASAFSRAFTRYYHSSPSQIRKA